MFWQRDDLRVFEYDAGFDRHPPVAVVVPGTAEEIAACVKAASRDGVAVVPRGAGTGLSGGTIACGGAMVVATSRLRRILAIDAVGQTALVEPGVPNLQISTAAREAGLFFAPDPASQRVSTIGGNIGTNAGGPHALRYGSITNHVLGIEMVLPDGEIAVFGGRTADLPGYDCVPFIVGSEGTPVNVAFDAHLPEDAGSLLLVEVEGLREETEVAASAIVAICEARGAFGVRTATTPAERELLWKARKLGYPALARIRPNNYLHDAVVPRSKLPEVLAKVNAIADRYGYVIANMFHIGDGNLHPVLLFDGAVEPIERVMEASAEILKVAIDAGGTLSGEHGIGLEKNHFMFWVFGPEDLEAMQRARGAFDPNGTMNPGKIFPGGSICADIPTERIKRGQAEGMWV